MHEESPRRAPSRRSFALVVAALVIVVLGWIVVLPPSSGADEPGHVIRSAALVRGQLDDQGRFNSIFSDSFELPAWVGWPEPECWAFKLDVPVSCSTLLDEPSGVEPRGTRSADYPVWGHLLPGLPTLLVDDPIGNRLARVTHAVVPLALLAAALAVASRRGRWAVAGTLLATTPVVLFNMATVNPSGLVIAGGIGLWTVLSGPAPNAPPDRLVGWLAAASWAAMVLPRRDGLIYACVILAIALGLGARSPVDLRRLLGRPQTMLVVASTLATLVWAVFSDSASSRLLLAVPLAPVAVWAIRAALVRSGWSIGRMVGALTVTGLVTSVLAVIFVQGRDSALDTVKWRLIVAETGDDLFEAFGVLGWLDAPMPASFAFLFVALVGVGVGVVGLARPRALVAVVTTLLVGVLLSWFLTATQVNGSPEYWQGRYYLPLLAGVPILLGNADVTGVVDRRRVDAVARAIAIGVAIVSMVALGAAMRRFAVGIDGTMAPWRWHTFGAAVSPLFPLLVTVAGWAALLWALDRHVDAVESTADTGETPEVDGAAPSPGEHDEVSA